MAYLYVKIDAPKVGVADTNMVIGNLAQSTVSSTSGASTTLTIVTSAAHGLVAGDVVAVNGLRTSAGVPVANTEGPVEGLYTVVTTPLTTSLTITISSALTTGQAASGQIMKNSNASPNALSALVNMINGIQAGTVDACVTLASSSTNSSALPSTGGAFNIVNLK